MEKPTSFKYENFDVYPADEVYKYDPIFFKGINLKSIKKSIIDKFKLIENKDYILLSQKKNMWSLSAIKNPKALLCLTKEWVDTQVPKFKDITEANDYECPPAPEILELNDDENFKDIEGNILDIEVRGTRNKKDTYFKVKDISTGFEMPSLLSSLLHKDKCYTENIHFKYFSIYRKQTNSHTTLSKKELFLTCDGLMKVIYSSRSSIKCNIPINMDTFLKKNDIIHNYISNNKNMKVKIEKNTPGIYLYIIGNAKDLLKNDSYTDNDLLCKYGKTTDIYERNRTHIKNFKKEFGVKIKLYKFSIIDDKNLSTAEYVISKIFNKEKIKYNNYNELIVIKDTELHLIDSEYNNVQNLYLECTKGLKEENNKLKEEIKILKNKIKSMDGDKCNEEDLTNYLQKVGKKIDDNGVKYISNIAIPNKNYYNKNNIIAHLIDFYLKLDKLNYNEKYDILENISDFGTSCSITKNIQDLFIQKLRKYNFKLLMGTDYESDRNSDNDNDSDNDSDN